VNQGGVEAHSNVIMDEWKKNPPKILIFGAITAPRLLNPRTSHVEGAKFDETKRGIIQVRRVSKYQRKTKQHQRPDLKFSDCTVNGAVYEYMITGPSGLADYLDKYYEEDDKDDTSEEDSEDDHQVRTTAWGIPIELTSVHQKKNTSAKASSSTTTVLFRL